LFLHGLKSLNAYIDKNFAGQRNEKKWQGEQWSMVESLGFRVTRIGKKPINACKAYIL